VSEFAMSDAEPLLSAVVVIVSDTLEPRAHTGHLAGCLGALKEQIDAPPFEVIVPYHAATDGIAELQKDFAEVRFVAVEEAAIGERKPGSREHHDVLRSRGLALARGALLALLEDHARPDPRWCANLAAAHRQTDAAAVGGAIENGIDRSLSDGEPPGSPSVLKRESSLAFDRRKCTSARIARTENRNCLCTPRVAERDRNQN